MFQQASRFLLPHREYCLFNASIDAVSDSFAVDPKYPQIANLWWPDDHAWLVATDIDLMSTYMGGSLAAIEAILSNGKLEADLAKPEDDITIGSDTVN